MELPLEQYRVLVESAPTLIWRAGLDGTCDYFNDAWLSFTGRSLEQEVGVGWARGVHPDDLERSLGHYRAHFERREAFEMEYRLLRHDGVYRWVLDRGAPYHDARGGFAGFIGHCIDVHERRVADEAKATFLAMLAHELRTPLQSLVLLVRELRLSSDRAEAVAPSLGERVHRQVSRLRRMVEHASSGIELALRRDVVVDCVDIDLARVVRDEIEPRTQAGPRGVTVRLAIEGEPRPVHADAERIAQALDIILDNAMKVSPEKSNVEVLVQYDRASVLISVHDQGPGIPRGDYDRIGVPFFRASNAHPRERPGIGLGLAIASGIAHAHGGRLLVEPREPHGTTVSLVLPSEVEA